MHPAAAKALFEEQTKHLSSALCERRGWVIHQVAYPVISVSYTAPGRITLRLTYTCDDWNDRPPSIRLEDPNGTPLRNIPPNPTGVFNGGNHPLTNLPFVCMRGSREYHTHPSHVADSWEAIRNGSKYDLGGIMTQIWNAWLKGAN
jgi:hypothetical protein